MKAFFLTTDTLPELIGQIQCELELVSPLKVMVGPAHTGTWGMAKLWRMWMATTAVFMTNRGVTMPLMISQSGKAFGAEDAHELFSHQWLGCDEEGNRLSWSKAGHGDMRAADRGERFNALRQHEAWSLEKGLTLFKPREGEYYTIEQETNK